MKKGFTLIELMVVVLIMGILASMSIPYYYKTVETSKATDSVSIGHLLGSANRMYILDNPGAASAISGQVTNSCNTSNCTGASNACRIVACSYVAQQDWDAGSYNYYVCNGNSGGSCCAANAVSCTFRKSGAGSPYSGWGYRFDASGGCTSLGGAPSCPKF
ncbi:MAG: type II secretion system protein [Elusimicrobia bacterium]|nr:type II secretion system protein [Elusimicrobiota bacterium]